MADITLRGMTWQHRRAVDPLLATLPGFRARRPEIDVVWDARPLHGFEFAPVDELARRYDLIVLDHPFVGEIAQSRCLMPVDDLLLEPDRQPEPSFVGPSLESYRYAGRIWAVPIDAACQVAAFRPDLLARLDAAVPRTWEAAVALGERGRRVGARLAIALAGVHSLMTFFTLCANLGRPCASQLEAPLVEPATAREALGAMRHLLGLCPPEVLGWSSIGLHDAMVGREDLLYCPAVYCYATYAEADMQPPLRFADLPGLAGPSPRGSTLGGTGLGISAATRHPEAARAYASYLVEADTQQQFARHHGQPARVEAWEDPEIDGRFGGCFGATRATVEQSWIRPRYPGYLRFQARAGALVEAHLRGDLAEDRLLGALQDLHAGRGEAQPS